MQEFIIPIGSQLAVSIFKDEQSQCAVILTRQEEEVVEAKIYCPSGESVEWSIRALEQAIATLQAYNSKGLLGKMIRKRIEEIDHLIAEEEDDSPSPTDELGDIPF